MSSSLINAYIIITLFKICRSLSTEYRCNNDIVFTAFFNWFYWFINIGALLAFTLVAYVQENISFFYGNAIAATSLVIAFTLFLIGKRSYTLRTPVGSALSSTLRIVKEAIKKSRRLTLSGSCACHWLDRAKMSYGGSYSSLEVEDVKKVYRLLPIFVTFVLYSTVIAQVTNDYSKSIVYNNYICELAFITPEW